MKIPGSDFIIFILSAITLILVVLKCFKINASRGGEKFIQKFLVLDFIITLRLTLILIALWLPVYFLGLAVIYSKSRPPSNISNFTNLPVFEMILDPILEIVFLIIWFYLMKSSFQNLIKGLNKTQAQNSAEQ